MYIDIYLRIISYVYGDIYLRTSLVSSYSTTVALALALAGHTKKIKN